MNIINLFDEYRFKTRNLPLIEGELHRQDKRIMLKTSSIKAEGEFSDKDLGDHYNEMIERKLRLEDRVLEYQSFIALINDAMESLKEESPIEYEAIKMRHIECKGINQIMQRLNFGRTQCWKYIKNGEKRLSYLLNIVK